MGGGSTMEVSTFLRCALATLALLAAALLTASSATAQTAPAPGSFRLLAGDGYMLEALASPAAFGQPRTVLVTISKPGAFATYSAGGYVTPTSFKADFGEFGRIDVGYVPTGGTRVEDVCSEPMTFLAGYYQGQIDFRGEQRFAGADTSWANGRVTSRPCDSYSEGITGSRIAGAQLSALSIHGKQGVAFEAGRNAAGKPSHFRATSFEAVGDVGILRSVESRGTSGAFRFPLDGIGRTIVHPPSPFSGTGLLDQRRRGRASWRGTLSVDFPGRADVDLVVPNTSAFLQPHTASFEHSVR